MTESPAVRPPLAERLSAGKALRKRSPRSAHADWQPSERDPVAILRAGDRGRLRELLPIRYGRMCTSPLGFLRGAAAVMAADLAPTPVTGLHVQACGDAHLLNFGGFSTPERRLVFDVTDFDESLAAPWEWDVKRLAASVAVAGRHLAHPDHDCAGSARAAVGAYREMMGELAAMKTLDVWYARLDLEAVAAASATRSATRCLPGLPATTPRRRSSPSSPPAATARRGSRTSRRRSTTPIIAPASRPTSRRSSAASARA